MRVAHLAALLALATGAVACTIQDDLVPCGDLACPIGTVCSAFGCAWPDQLTTCQGLGDGTACMTTHFSGVCMDEVCREQLCGDGVLVPGEVCDDGNQRAGDGCSADCLSTETCGNSIVDGVAQEECDNSVRGLSHDGCTSTCLIELPSWVNVTQDTPGSLAALAYDSVRHRTVGIDYTFNMVWEFDGQAWRAIVPLKTPERRYGYALAYDDAHARVVMFGGTLDGTSPPLNETWTWDGVVWTQEAPVTAPAAREDAVMAFDATRSELVMFGGHVGSTRLRDTWVWTGTSWSPRTPATSPNYTATSASNGYRGVAMTYDPASAKIVLFADTGRTWLWDGVNWTVQPLGTDPVARVQPILTPYAGGGVLLFGGFDQKNGYADLTDTWRWNAGTWTQLNPAAHPPWAFSAVLDTTRSRVVASQNNFTWEWTGTNWVQRVLPNVPSVRSPPGAYLATRGRTVMITNGETWEWDGLAWGRRGGTNPPVRTDPQLVGMVDHVLLFGGYASGSLADTWEYDGTAWTSRSPAMSPPPRFSGGIAYDRGRDRVVLFGGYDGTALGDTWEWNGTTWTEMKPTVSPSPRGRVMMAYDEVHQTTLLVGGSTTSMVYDEVWTWDGVNWTNVTPAVMPPTQGGRLVWNPQRGVITFLVDRGYSRPYELWEWDGSGWKYVPVTNPLPNTNGWGLGLISYDAARSELFIFGDSQGGIGAHALRYERQSVPAEACLESDTDGDGLSGCADPDCWGRCTPMCGPFGICDPAGPSCGDGTCSVLEDAHLCPADC